MCAQRIDDSGLGDIRVSDLIRYFQHSGRSAKCPHCPHAGTWEFHIKLDPVTNEAEADPVLIPFAMETVGSGDVAPRCAAITCPNCGSLSLISMYKIDKFKREAERNG